MAVENTTDNFSSYDGTNIFYQSWTPGKGKKINAVLAIIHGYAEHGGRYAHVGEYFAGKGYCVAALDHRSHGNSDGKDTYFKSIDECVEDVDRFIKILKEENPGKPFFILAHSMGGLITTAYVIDRQPEANGVLLTGPAVMISKDISPMLVKVSSVIAKVAPKLKTIKLDGDAVSRDPAEVEKYNKDPLNYRGGIPAATGAAMNRSIKRVHANLDKFTLPVRLMHGSADRLADPRGSEKLLEGFSSKDKERKVYEGLFHEILNEPEKEQIMSECFEWMSRRM